MKGTCDSELMGDFFHKSATGRKDSVFGPVHNPQQLRPIDRKAATQSHRNELFCHRPSLVVHMRVDRNEDALGDQVLGLDYGDGESSLSPVEANP